MPVHLIDWKGSSPKWPVAGAHVFCFLSTSVYSALGVSAIMRYINRRVLLTYLLTYILTCRSGQNMFDPTKCHILTFKTVVGMDNAASFTSSRMKDLCQKMEGKINFFDAPIQAFRNRDC